MSPEQGRRERNKLDKQERIFAAASELFGADGYARVTTQQIAERAGVTNGTLFRYAANKAELLLMVMNSEFDARIAEGREAAASESAVEPAARVMALLAPIARGSRDPHESTTHYQRELLFGEPTERYRAEGLALTATLQKVIANLLRGRIDARPENDGASERPAGDDFPRDRAASNADADADAMNGDDDANLAARAISNVLHLEIARAALEGSTPDDLTATIARQVDLISSGYLRSRHPLTPDASLTESPTKEDHS
jgi:AcrR family transcriptional regulator